MATTLWKTTELYLSASMVYYDTVPSRIKRSIAAEHMLVIPSIIFGQELIKLHCKTSVALVCFRLRQMDSRFKIYNNFVFILRSSD